ncbi:MAG: 1-acyl-sn-glycerol-3-phosphate acyltransferase, partial [Bryobacteraceae bacterium]
TEGTRKLKRAALAEWTRGGAAPPARTTAGGVEAILARYARGRPLTAQTTLDDLGLTSLERVELMMEIEQRLDTPVDEGRFTGALTVADLAAPAAAPPEPIDFPRWSRGRLARAVRRVSLPTWMLPLARVFLWLRVEGRVHLAPLDGPVIFAANHQSHLDGPAILAALPARFRYRVCPAMSKEFFRAHFFPEKHSRLDWFTNSLNYYLAALLFNGFPFAQREGGTRETLRYAGELAGDGWSILIFPEGKRTQTGEIAKFFPGVGLMASRLRLPVVPVRLEGLDRVLHSSWNMARPGRVTVRFGPPLRLEGDDYAALAAQVEAAVRAL